MIQRKNAFPFLLCLLLAGVAIGDSGCGYRLGGVPCGSFLPVKTLAVPLFQNQSYEPTAADIFTVSFRENIQSLPCIKLRSRDHADAVFYGTILLVSTYPVAVDEEFLALEYRMLVKIFVAIKNRKDGKILWQKGPIEELTTFYASPATTNRPADPLLYDLNKTEALIRISQRLSDRIMDLMLIGSK